MKETFSTQKVQDILEVVADSVEAHNFPKDFIAIFDGQVYQAGNHEQILGRLFRTFPGEFTALAIASMDEKLSRLEGGDASDPTSPAYWSEGQDFELGTTELDAYKKGKTSRTHECLDTIQDALSRMNRQGLINDDGSVIGRDLRRVLCKDLGLDEIVNFKELDYYLDVCCGGLLIDGSVTIGKHESNSRTRMYNFLDSPFKLY